MAAAAHGNVVAKISGLNTALSAGDWDAGDLAEAVGVALAAFGPSRLMCGSDWPVALLNGDYERVWRETVRVISDCAPEHAEQLLSQTALRVYDLDRLFSDGGAAGGSGRRLLLSRTSGYDLHSVREYQYGHRLQSRASWPIVPPILAAPGPAGVAALVPGGYWPIGSSGKKPP